MITPQTFNHVFRDVIIVIAFTAIVSCNSENKVGSAPIVESSIATISDLQTSIEAIRKHHNLPALAAMILVDGEIVENIATGLRAWGTSEMVTINDRWHLGSVTKAMTATLAARIVERGDINWDTTIVDVFPDMQANIRDEYKTVRLEELLTHLSGLPRDPDDISSFSGSRENHQAIDKQRRQWTAELLVLAPTTERGTYLYSNNGYVIAGAMLEEVTGMTWEELMIIEVFIPLGMNDSGFGPPGSPGIIDQPWGHQQVGNGWLALEAGSKADLPIPMGPAALVHTSLADYAKYATMHLRSTNGEGGFLSQESIAKLHTPVTNNYAMGWGVGTSDVGFTLQHGGTNLLWFSEVILVPGLNLALVSFTNAGGDIAAKATSETLNVLTKFFNTSNQPK
ncbi:MAG: beta-lactamase family protein [Colwellia sp.]|nr:beta-lactamase family protein [Colwellia sp.]